jgi:hypothetical protein
MRMFMFIRLRPSSHSEDGTVIAYFDREDQAKLSAKKLARELESVSCSYFGRKVKVLCCDSEYGALDDARGLLSSYGANDVEEVDSYQELTIQVTLPLRITSAAIPLVLDQNTAELLQNLYDACPEPTREETKTKTVLTFRYKGPTIYMKFAFRKAGKPSEELWFNNDPRPVPPNFKITGLV